VILNERGTITLLDGTKIILFIPLDVANSVDELVSGASIQEISQDRLRELEIDLRRGGTLEDSISALIKQIDDLQQRFQPTTSGNDTAQPPAK